MNGEGYIIRLALEVVRPASKARRHPDVWGAELPTDGTGRAEEARLFEDRQGRIQILYAFNTATQRIYRAYSFFDKAILAEWRSEPPSDAAEIYQGFWPRETKPPPMVVEIHQRVRSYEQDQRAHLLADERVHFPDMFRFPETGGTLVFARGFSDLSGFGKRPLCTYEGDFFLNKPHTDHSRDEEFQSLALIRIYPESQSTDPAWGYDAAYCASSRLRGRGVDIIMADLHDGTFLIKDKGYPLLIRFRPNLESPYLRERDDLFLVPEAGMMRWFKEKKGDIDAFDQMVVEELTGK